MKQLGFTCLHSNARVFCQKRLNIVVIAYVDDCVFTGKDHSQILKLKKQFMEIWKCQDLGEAKEFLKMRI